MPAADQRLMRAINRFKVLQATRNAELISRVDIARATGLSQASVTGITADLIKEGLLFEKSAGESIGGRKPIMLALNAKGALTLGVFLSIQEIKVVLVDLKATIIHHTSLPLENRHYHPDEIADLIVQTVQTCLKQTEFKLSAVSGIGVAIPGLVDSKSGIVRFLPNYTWEDVNLQQILTKKIGIPIYIENSANTLTLAEQWFGDGRGIENLLTVNLEHGVGLGIVINGQLYRGSMGMAGEFGHITMDPAGPLCRCGKRGCLESYVGNNAILREAIKAVQQKKWQVADSRHITINQVIEAAETNNTLKKIYNTAGTILGTGLVNLIKIFNPSRIILSGKGVLAGDLLFRAMYKSMDNQLNLKTDERVEIIIKKWTSTDHARGAGTLVLQEIYQSPANRMIPVL